MRNKRTKIVCTIGPGTDAPGVLERMMASGMNVARFNFSHGTHEDHARRMRMVREAARTVGVPIGMLLDTKGPEMRLGTFAESPVVLEEGECIITDDALDAIVARYSNTTGIRDLEQAAEHIAANALYQIEVNHVKQVVFDAEMVEKLLG